MAKKTMNYTKKENAALRRWYPTAKPKVVKQKVYRVRHVRRSWDALRKHARRELGLRRKVTR